MCVVSWVNTIPHLACTVDLCNASLVNVLVDQVHCALLSNVPDVRAEMPEAVVGLWRRRCAYGRGEIDRAHEVGRSESRWGELPLDVAWALA
jgi:hypothetical protein